MILLACSDFTDLANRLRDADEYHTVTGRGKFSDGTTFKVAVLKYSEDAKPFAGLEFTAIEQYGKPNAEAIARLLPQVRS